MNARDPIGLQVLVGRLKAVCDEMGAVLIRAAHSPNIKERRDCSTALFDARGELVMQAEHIPVHLGSMPDAVAAIISEPQRRGRTWILNDPFAGGTHLPDITLITPVIGPGEELLGFVASRAHHADVGGPTPGSMPADSATLGDEGVVIAPRSLAGIDDLDDLTRKMRNPLQRQADLRAQLAANETGCRRLLELLDTPDGRGTIAGMAAILDYAEQRTRARLDELPDGAWEAADVLEGGPDGSDDIARPRAGDDLGRRAGARLRRQLRPGRRQPELSAAGHALGGPVRRPRAAGPGRTGVRGRASACPRGGARRLDPERARARLPWRPATSRRRAGWPTSSSARWGRWPAARRRARGR